MHPYDLWWLIILLWLGLSWLTAYLRSEITSVTRLVSLKKLLSKPLTPRPEDDCPDYQTASDHYCQEKDHRWFDIDRQ